MRYGRSFLIGIIGLMFAVTGHSQSISELTESVIPLKTNRKELQSLLGVAGQDGNEVQYRTGELIINVVYSAGECEKIPLRSYRLKAKKDVIISYEIFLLNRMELSALNLNLDDFLIDKSGDLINFVTYRKKDGGTDIQVKIEEDSKLVMSIERSPTKIDRENCMCP